MNLSNKTYIYNFVFQINAHPVLEGSSGYAHVSISGEPNSILSLTANGADQRERLNSAPEVLHTFEDRNLVIVTLPRCG